MAPSEPPPDEGYPVLFWVHGGAFEQGLGNCALYNGSNFALNGIVSVVINYRLGVLGFMASESMQVFFRHFSSPLTTVYELPGYRKKVSFKICLTKT